MIKIIIACIGVSGLGFLVRWAIHDIEYETSPFKLIKKLFPGCTEAYKQGLPCISFETFVSIYNVNPKRWHLEDPYWGYVGYKGKDDWQIFGERIYWKTTRDRKRYAKWYKVEKKRLEEKESQKIVIKMTNIALEDIEELKWKINKDLSDNLSNIAKEKENNQTLYEQIMQSYKIGEKQ